MKYVQPQNVTSPLDYLSNVRVIHNGGAYGVSVAKLNWDGGECYGLRWNTSMREREDPDKKSNKKTCVGMPTSRGLPVWFIMPDELLDCDSELWDEIRKAIETQGTD